MATGIIVLIAGVVGVLVAGFVSHLFIKARDHSGMTVPGSGVVPGWLSGIYLLSFGGVIVGIIIIIVAAVK